MIYWFFMVIAIVAEVAGTLAMKYSIVHQAQIWMVMMYFMLIISYTALALAVKKIPIAVAYGAWESLGLILISLFSFILFGEPLSITKMIAISCILIGIFLLEIGTISPDEENEDAA